MIYTNADIPPLPEVPPKELPPPPPPTGKTTNLPPPPASTPVPHPDNTHSSDQGKANGNTHFPHSNTDILPLPEVPRKRELPPPPPPKTTDLPPPTTDLLPANIPVSHPDNSNIHTPEDKANFKI